MKANLSLIFAVLLTASLSAQSIKGKRIVTAGSNLALVFGNNKLEFAGTAIQDIKTQNISLQPSIGFFITNNVAVGVSILIENVRNEVDNNSEEQNSFGMAPFVRYFLNGTKVVKPYLNIDAGYLKITNQTKVMNQLDVNDSYGGFAMNVGAGLAAFLSDKVAFDAQLSYGTGNLAYNGDPDLRLKVSGIGVILGFTVIF